MKIRIFTGLMISLTLAGMLTTLSCADKMAAQPGGEVVGEDAPEPVPAQPEAVPLPVVDPAPVAKAPSEPAPVGDPEPAVAGEGEGAEKKAAQVNFLDQHVYFAFDGDGLDAAARAVLADKAGWIKANPRAKVLIEGHCDQRGSVDYNQGLGLRRAFSVKDHLVGLGIEESRLNWVSMGKAQPLEDGRTPAAHRANRRVQFKLIPSDGTAAAD